MTEQIYTQSELEAAATRAARDSSLRMILIVANDQRAGNDNGYLTWKELEDHYARCGYGFSRVQAVKESILSHREPDYPVGTVVKDADGNWYRKYSDGWGVFGFSTRSPYGVLKQPLEVMGK